MVHFIKQAEGKRFKNYNEAINFLIRESNKDEELDSYIRTEINSSDEIQIGNEILPAIDVFDFL